MLQAVWIELPVQDLERAIKFYTTVFDLKAGEIVDEGVRRTNTLVNTSPEGNPGISLNQTANFEPNDKGALVYLDAGEDLTPTLQRIEPAGGRIVEAKTSMGSMGCYATFQDTEGNLLALYSLR